MKNISLNLDDTTFENTTAILSQIKKNRNRYINEAIEYYNKLNKRKILENKLKQESLACGKESMKVLKEFEAFEYED